jgi:hypothetical protein
MSVDLVLGVIQAADTTKSQRMRERLAELGGGPKDVFEKILSAATLSQGKVGALEGGLDLVAQVIAANDPEKHQKATRQLAGLDILSTNGAGENPQRKVAQKLEETLMASVVEELVPKDSPSLYGDDDTVGLTRQFQVDHLASATAASSPLGLADSLYGRQDAAGMTKANQWPYFVRRSITPYAA